MKPWLPLLLSLCGACASPAPALRPVAELPERHREAWQAWKADDPAWPELREAARQDPDLAGFLADNLLRELLAAYGRREFTTLADARLGPFERARADLLLLPEVTLPRLVELLAVGNGEASELAADLLVRLGRDAVVPVAALLERREVPARQRAARLLGRLPLLPGDEEAPVRDALGKALAGDGDWLVRGLAAESLALRGSRDRTTRPARLALVRALGDEDPAVHVRAAEGLGRLEDPEAVPALILYLERCLADARPAGVLAAQKSLRRLLGAASGSRTPAEWHELWRASRAR